MGKPTSRHDPRRCPTRSTQPQNWPTQTVHTASQQRPITQSDSLPIFRQTVVTLQTTTRSAQPRLPQTSSKAASRLRIGRISCNLSRFIILLATFGGSPERVQRRNFALADSLALHSCFLFRPRQRSTQRTTDELLTHGRSASPLPLAVSSRPAPSHLTPNSHTTTQNSPPSHALTLNTDTAYTK